MKTINPLLSAVCLLAVLTMASCDKDDPAPGKSKTDLLTSDEWKLTTIKAFGIESPPEDCDVDDRVTYSQSGTYSLNEGTLKCDPDDESFSGTWQFKTNETVLSITFFGLTIDQTIVELTDTKLHLKYSLFGIEAEETYSH